MSWRSTPRFEVAAFGIASHLLLTPFGYPRLMYFMTNNRERTMTRKEWLAARLDLLKAEKERRRQELPWVRVGKGDRFDTDEGRGWLGTAPPGAHQEGPWWGPPPGK